MKDGRPMLSLISLRLRLKLRATVGGSECSDYNLGCNWVAAYAMILQLQFVAANAMIAIVRYSIWLKMRRPVARVEL